MPSVKWSLLAGHRGQHFRGHLGCGEAGNLLWHQRPASPAPAEDFQSDKVSAAPLVLTADLEQPRTSVAAAPGPGGVLSMLINQKLIIKSLKSYK